MLFSASLCGISRLASVAVLILGGQAFASTQDDSQVFASLREAIDAGDYQSQLPLDPIDKLDRGRSSGNRSGYSSPPGLDTSPLKLLLSVIAWVFVIAVAVLIVVAIVVALSKQSLEADPNKVVVAAEAQGAVARINSREGTREVSYLKRAEQLAAEGLYQEAVHMLLLGAIAHLSSTSRLHCHSSETSREVLRAYQAEPAKRHALQSLVVAVERSIFGGRPVSREEFDTCHVCLKTLVQEASG